MSPTIESKNIRSESPLPVSPGAPGEGEAWGRGESQEQLLKLIIVERKQRRPTDRGAGDGPDGDGVDVSSGANLRHLSDVHGKNLYCELTNAEGEQLTVSTLWSARGAYV